MPFASQEERHVAQRRNSDHVAKGETDADSAEERDEDLIANFDKVLCREAAERQQTRKIGAEVGQEQRVFACRLSQPTPRGLERSA